MRRFHRRSLLALLTATSTGVGLASCGGVIDRHGSASHVETTASRLRDAEDFDSDYGPDDDAILKYGHPASTLEKQAVTSLVKRYYAAAAEHDGARACSILTASLVKKVPENRGQNTGPHIAPITACALAASRIFNVYHRELAGKARTLEVTGLRIEGREGLALLRFAATPEPRKIAVRRERGTWKIDELLDGGVP